MWDNNERLLSLSRLLSRSNLKRIGVKKFGDTRVMFVWSEMLPRERCLRTTGLDIDYRGIENVISPFIAASKVGFCEPFPDTWFVYDLNTEHCNIEIAMDIKTGEYKIKDYSTEQDQEEFQRCKKIIEGILDAD